MLKIIFFFILIASQHHLALANSNINDSDLRRLHNKEFAQKNSINYQYQYFTNTQTNEKFLIGVYKKHPIGKNKYLVLHDSEDGSFDGGLDAIQNGGLMVVLENNENRYLYDHIKKKPLSIDPNRIFKHNNKYYPLAQQILKSLELKSDDFIISLHNNNPNTKFGMKNIKSYGASSTPCFHDKDEKNLFWLSYQTNTNKIQNITDFLCKDKKYNVVWEKVPTIESGDGSLSIYATNKGYNYINIEIRAGIKNNTQSEEYAKQQQIRYINKFNNYFH